MAKRQHIIIDRRSFLHLAGASLAACGATLALSRPAHAEAADPTGESLGSFTIDDFIERIGDSEIVKYASTGTLSLWIASAFARSLSSIPNLPVSIADYIKSPTVISQNIWSRLPEPILHAGPNHIVDDWIYRQIWLKLPPNARTYYQVAGGVPPRTPQEAFRVFKTIPLQIVMGGEEALLRFHQNKHWSHIIPKSQGGSSLASNGIFEYYLYNLWRGDETMTVAELERAKWELNEEAKRVRLRHLAHGEWELLKSQTTSLQKILRSPEFTGTLRLAARPILPGAVAFAVADVAVAVLDEGLRYHDGDIDRSELFSSVAASVGKDALFAVAVFGVILGLVMAVPALGALLASVAPVLVLMPFLLYGHRFYSLSAEWVQRIGFAPVIAAWNSTKEIPMQVWVQAASSFESIQKAARDASERALKTAGDASERAWQGIGSFSEDTLHGIGDFSDSAWQGIGGAPASVFQGTRGITIRTWQGVGGLSDGAIEGIGDFSDGAIHGIGDFSERAWQGAGEFSDGDLDGIGDFPEGVWDAAGSTSEQTLEKAKDLLEEAEERLQNLWPFGE